MQAEKIVKSCSSEKEKLSLDDFRYFRNDLLKIFLLQAKRSDDMSNFTVEELDKFEKIDHNIIFIETHKNKPYKPYMIDFKFDFLKCVQNFIKFLRPLAIPDCSYVFTTSLGRI